MPERSAADKFEEIECVHAVHLHLTVSEQRALA